MVFLNVWEGEPLVVQELFENRIQIRDDTSSSTTHDLSMTLLIIWLVKSSKTHIKNMDADTHTQYIYIYL